MADLLFSGGALAATICAMRGTTLALLGEHRRAEAAAAGWAIAFTAALIGLGLG